MTEKKIKQELEDLKTVLGNLLNQMVYREQELNNKLTYCGENEYSNKPMYRNYITIPTKEYNKLSMDLLKKNVDSFDMLLSMVNKIQTDI